MVFSIKLIGFDWIVIAMNLILIGLNWNMLLKCLDMTFVLNWRHINKTELN